VVQVDAWDAEGHANVKYRGANWQVTLAPGFPATPGAFTIAEVMGNRLIVKPN
jgi:membrane protein implicated in regulation of membrane protease activity